MPPHDLIAAGLTLSSALATATLSILVPQFLYALVWRRHAADHYCPHAAETVAAMYDDDRNHPLPLAVARRAATLFGWYDVGSVRNHARKFADAGTLPR